MIFFQISSKFCITSKTRFAGLSSEQKMGFFLKKHFLKTKLDAQNFRKSIVFDSGKERSGKQKNHYRIFSIIFRENL